MGQRSSKLKSRHYTQNSCNCTPISVVTLKLGQRSKSGSNDKIWPIFRGVVFWWAGGLETHSFHIQTYMAHVSVTCAIRFHIVSTSFDCLIIFIVVCNLYASAISLRSWYVPYFSIFILLSSVRVQTLYNNGVLNVLDAVRPFTRSRRDRHGTWL